MAFVLPPDPAGALVLDGLEGTPARVSFRCGACGAEVSGDLWTWLGRAAPAGDLPRAERDALGLQSERVLDGEVARSGRLTAWIVDPACGCGARHRVVLGLSEVQPARYQARLHAVVGPDPG